MAMDSNMYVEVMRRCLKEKNLKVDVAKQVHDYINQSGMEQDRYVANNLNERVYQVWRIGDARGVFDKLVNKNVFGCTIMMGGYAKHRFHTGEAMKLFNQMCQNGVQPDANYFLDHPEGMCQSISFAVGQRSSYVCVRHAGLESDVLVGNSLVHMYANCGSLNDARVVFGRLDLQSMDVGFRHMSCFFKCNRKALTGKRLVHHLGVGRSNDLMRNKVLDQMGKGLAALCRVSVMVAAESSNAPIPIASMVPESSTMTRDEDLEQVRRLLQLTSLPFSSSEDEDFKRLTKMLQTTDGRKRTLSASELSQIREHLGSLVQCVGPFVMCFPELPLWVTLLLPAEVAGKVALSLLAGPSSR